MEKLFMVFGFDPTSYDAVLFVDQNKVVKEMLLTEFEAVLDGVVGEPEFADSAAHAVYLKINRRLDIIGAVFFIIHFDAKGNADRRWNIPLSQMVETAAFGPELNGVQLRIACRSQCQIPWHQQDLWEPDLSVGSNTLKMLSASIQANRLGLLVDDAVEQPPLLTEVASSARGVITDNTNEKTHEKAKHGSNSSLAEKESREEERYKMAQNIKKQRVYIASLKSLHEQEMEAQRKLYSKDREMFLLANKKLQEQIEGLELKYCDALIETENKQHSFDRQCQEYEQRLERMMDQRGIDHRSLRVQFNKDFQAKLIEQTTEIESKLEIREVEVYYREEQINRLKSEILDLKAYAKQLESQSVASEISSLVNNGVYFVVSQPGVGPMSIEAEDLIRFNSEPNLYLAERLGVSLDIYEAWLAHIKLPLCGGDVHTGETCGEHLEPVTTPQEFILGISDYCVAHQQGGLAAANGH
ncbi:hypothetical protein N9W57_08345 [Pseudomonadales bacterium]|nr:hypothetical protein [Pseudomonadales bacterium]